MPLEDVFGPLMASDVNVDENLRICAMMTAAGEGRATIPFKLYCDPQRIPRLKSGLAVLGLQAPKPEEP